MERLPQWLRRRFPAGESLSSTRATLHSLGLNTVCESACCPNLGECFGKRTATFLILGDVCTRQCRFCAVTSGSPAPPDPGEPGRVAEAARRMGLRHVVMTSVTRDDLADGGAGAFAAAIGAVRAGSGATVEVLTPDFAGSLQAVDEVARAGPEVYNHNLETVPRLYARVRPGAVYDRSLEVLARAKAKARASAYETMTKSGIMVGLGESSTEVREVMCDLRSVGCGLLTVGQYLRPGPGQLEVAEFVEPERFEEYRLMGEEMGFAAVAAGPFVRSSYGASSMLEKVQ